MCGRLDNLKEKAEHNSIRYKLQKQMGVFLWLTWSQFSCTFSVKHARVHLHGKVTRCTVLLTSPPFIRCLTSFCQTALPQLFFLWLNGHFIAEIMQCWSGALLEHQNTEMQRVLSGKERGGPRLGLYLTDNGAFNLHACTF